MKPISDKVQPVTANNISVGDSRTFGANTISSEKSVKRRVDGARLVKFGWGRAKMPARPASSSATCKANQKDRLRIAPTYDPVTTDGPM